MKWVIIGLLLIMALVLFPTVRWATSSINMTGFLPLFAMVTVMLPYIFVGLVIWFVVKNK
jgi:hypothetical protein